MKQRGEFICPNCGETVPAGAAACLECGSDERTGWNEDEAVYDGTGIEEPKKFDHDKWREGEGLKPKRPTARKIFVVVTALALLALFLLWFLGSRR